MKQILWLLKGAAMGAANVIPGVSGGTVALVTGIFEKLINSIKSFDTEAFKLFLTGKWRSFNEKVNLNFLFFLFAGIFLSIISIAKILGYLFEDYPVYIWSYFFGLILASVYFVGRTIDKWNIIVVGFFLLGTASAVLISFLNPATENLNFFYLMICGVVAICSMILPGLSGSFVLILMGNYELIMIDAVNNMNFGVLLPVVLGAIGGLIAFSHILSYIYKRFKDQTIAVLSGFILGSLIILWPWKEAIYMKNSLGEILKKKDGELIISRYEPVMPQEFNQEVWIALILMLAGVITIWGMEWLASYKKHDHAG